jgi:hypothetical protein
MNAQDTKDVDLRRRLMLLATSFALASCGGGGSGAAATPASPPASPTPPAPSPAIAKSAKRGVAYDVASAADLQALAPGVSWWYGWSAQANAALPSTAATQARMDFVPMLWNASYDAAAIEAMLLANPAIAYLLVLNEPNLVDQANMTPAQAAAIWPGYEAVAAATGVKIVGPAMNWGTLAGYSDPVAWLDAFYAAYRAANSNRDPQIDYLAFHWYDYGLAAQLDALAKYGKPFWVTELANWHSQADGAQIDTLAKQEAQMTEMVAVCESRADVFRYAWFTGRMSNDVHFTSLFGAGAGELSDLGRLYLTLPYSGS